MTETGAIVNRSIWREVPRERILLALLALVVVVALTILGLGLFKPILDQYLSRQTQTALTAYWLMRGGPVFAYETPVVGFPWSIPYEFPVYQIIAALVSAAGVPLDAAGRIVSFACFVGCLWPMHVLFRALKFDKFAFPCVAILFVLSPLYLYWGRTFMIETCALFFSLCWLAYFARYLADGTMVSAVIAAIVGSLGILAKSTTFPAFGVLGGFLFVNECYAAWSTGSLAKKFGLILTALIIMAVPFIIGGAWTVYSDTVKEANEIGAHLTSTALAWWNFGTWQQRFSSKLWQDLILHRSLTDAFGYAAVPAVALIGATVLRRQYAWAAAAAVFAFLVPFLVFANLHIVHSYYQTANAIFIIAAAGLGLAAVAGTRWGGVAVVLLLLIGAGQLLYFKSVYAINLTADLKARPQFRMAEMARAQTPPGSSLLIFGEDWSSAVPYYAQRKALVVPNWMPLSYWQRMAAQPQALLGPAPLAGIILCRSYAPTDAERKVLIDQLIAGRRVLGEAYDCTLYAAEKN